MNFARYLRNLFYGTLLGNCFCSTEKYFANKIEKNPLGKEKKIEATCKEKNDTRKTKTQSTFALSLHILLLFKNFFISLFSAPYDI